MKYIVNHNCYTKSNKCQVHNCTNDIPCLQLDCPHCFLLHQKSRYLNIGIIGSRRRINNRDFTLCRNKINEIITRSGIVTSTKLLFISGGCYCGVINLLKYWQKN